MIRSSYASPATEGISVYYANNTPIPRSPDTVLWYTATVSTIPGNAELAGFYRDLTVPETGSIAANEPWVIATVAPEPATLTLLASALLGVGAVYLRRSAKARAIF